MSLETLINNLTPILKIDSFEVYKKINDLLENLGTSFSETKLEQYSQKSPLNPYIILREMNNIGIIKESYHYECNVTGESDNSDNLTDKCIFCHQNIEDSLNHDILKFYSIKKNIRDSNKIAEIKLKHYLTNGFRPNYNKLVKSKDILIPFIGAGLSIPLGYPSWKGLLELLKTDIEENDIQTSFQRYIDKGDFLGALDYLKDNTVISTEDRIKEELINYIDSMTLKEPYEVDNNYLDLLNLNKPFIITTNYDNVFTKLATKNGSFSLPLVISEITNFQSILSTHSQRVIHLHGNFQKPETMIVTKKDYEELYSNPNTKERLLSIMSNKSLVFIGFSFSDIFFTDLYKKIIDTVKGTHFIISPDIPLHQAQEFQKINLTAISLNVSKNPDGYYNSNDYICALRTILDTLS